MRVRIALNSHVYDTVSYFFGGSTLMLAYLVYNITIQVRITIIND